ncbi:MAG: hypothetical protein MI674_00850 [Cytophagales bacterium]|nr:hypothetical protein [Cytophagales bacterium]
MSLSVGFNLLISGHAATQATGLGLLTWQVYFLLKTPAFAGHTTQNSELEYSNHVIMTSLFLFSPDLSDVE